MSSMGPLGGILGSAAGSPLSQTKGAATERANQDSSAAERIADADKKSEKASGIGQTEQDGETSDRDADGRRLWERTTKKKKQEESEESTEPTKRRPKGDTGGQLDLLG